MFHVFRVFFTVSEIRDFRELILTEDTIVIRNISLKKKYYHNWHEYCFTK
jgi:hypothetical protein